MFIGKKSFFNPITHNRKDKIMTKNLKTYMTYFISAMLLYVLSYLEFFNDNTINILSVFYIVHTVLNIMEKTQEQEKKQRDMYLESLTSIYKQIFAYMKSSPNPHRNIALQNGVEEAVVHLQLYGTNEEIKLLHTAVDTGDFDKILKSLRKRLRKECNLKEIDKDIVSVYHA